MNEYNINKNKLFSGFKVSDEYFEEVEINIIQKLGENNQSKIISLWKQKRIWMTSVAALLLVSIALPIYFSMQKNEVLENSAIEEYLVALPSTTSYEIAENLTDIEIKQLEEELSLKLTDEEIDDYLNENISEIDYYSIEE